MPAHRPAADSLFRWSAPVAAGLAMVLTLALFLTCHLRQDPSGITGLLELGFRAPAVRAFALHFALTMLVPFYLGWALVIWLLTLGWIQLVRVRTQPWRAGEAFALTLSALAWSHLWLWWQVPTTLALLPGLRRLPFYLLAVLFAAGASASPVAWVRRSRPGRLRGAVLLSGWLLLWTLPGWLPEALPRLPSVNPGGNQEARILVIGLDGLREDVGQAATQGYAGTPYPNAYTVVPATRLLWHILWGGDPLVYTVGQVAPGIDEYAEHHPLPILEAAQTQGWRPRFYTDDGGTMGLVGRALPFDDLLMPAAGWENFANSNLSASFPLFAAWENLGRPFPTTNPWARLDAGLREALRLGRGSKWVMFHSCLAHTPIFLRRNELQQIPRWWAMSPAGLEPYRTLSELNLPRVRGYDQRRDPLRVYTLRMQSILRAWEPLWNGLARDPQYRQATRILFSDHGERFYSVNGNLNLAGVHGFNLDPWETRVMLKVAGPGFAQAPGPANPATVSLLSLRDGFRAALATDHPLSPSALERAYPEAPLRMNGLDLSLFTLEPGDYRRQKMQDIAAGICVAPDGLWFTRFLKSPAERGEEVSIGWGRGPNLEVFKPLRGGGAHRYRFENFAIKGIETVTEQAYAQEKAKSIRVLGKP